MKTTSVVMVSDEQLWQQSRTGDREAFGCIVERYQSLVCSLAYSMCGSLSRSEDLAQETFLTAWQGLGELREPSKLRAWLCGIVRNLAANALHREQRRGGPSESLEGIDEPAATEADPAAQVVTKEEETLLWRSLAGLPETYREPMVLFYRQGQSVAEVAVALDLSQDAIKQRLSRGRAMLRDDLAAIVESVLIRTKPTGAFAVGVLAVLPAIASSTVEAAIAGGTVQGGSAVATKGVVATIGKLAILWSAIGFIIGALSLRSATAFARSPEERACLLRCSRRMVTFSWLMSLGLVLAVISAGKLYNPSTLWSCFGLVAWVAVLVGTILWYCARIDREVLRIRKETRSDDESWNGTLVSDESGFHTPKLSCELSYESKRRFLGLPLLAISGTGAGAGSKRRRKMMGWIAIGDIAISPFFALGGIAIGPFAFGGVTLGLVSFSFCGIAFGALAFGIVALALGWCSFGIVAIGWKAAAGGAVVAGDYALGVLARAAEVNTPAVKDWFLSQWFTAAAQWFFHIEYWLILLIIFMCLGRAVYKARQWRRVSR